MPGRAENQGREAGLQMACRQWQGAMPKHCRKDWCLGVCVKKPSTDWERDPGNGKTALRFGHGWGAAQLSYMQHSAAQNRKMKNGAGQRRTAHAVATYRCGWPAALPPSGRLACKTAQLRSDTDGWRKSRSCSGGRSGCLTLVTGQARWQLGLSSHMYVQAWMKWGFTCAGGPAPLPPAQP